MLATQEDIDKAYKKGIITSWEHELASWQVSGKISQDEATILMDLIYEDIKERFEPKP